MRPITRETIVEERRQPALRWSAVFAGAAVAVGLWVLFQIFVLGFGLAAIDVDNTGSVRGASIGASISTLIAPILALFVGGIVAGRLSSHYGRGNGALHGFVVWALTSVLGVLATVWMVTTIASGALRVGTSAMQAGGAMIGGTAEAAGSIDAGQAMSTLGIDPNDLLAPVNEKLRAQGKPEITADQLSAALRGVVKQGLHQGFDRKLFVQQLAQNTSLSQADAEDVANQLGERWKGMSSKVERAGNEATHSALEAADKAGQVLLWVGLAMLVGLIGAVIGGLIGVPRLTRREREEEETVVTMPPPGTTTTTTTAP